jgi:DNA polymerase
MRVAALASEDDFDGWRDAARALAYEGVAPEQVHWQVGEAPQSLFGEATPVATAAVPQFAVPRAFVDLARSALCHSDPERFSLLYILLCRIRADPKAIEDKADPLVRRLDLLAKDVRRDIHKMHAFVRFREVETDAGERLVRAGPPYRPRRHALLRAPLRQHGLVDPDAGTVGAL